MVSSYQKHKQQKEQIDKLDITGLLIGRALVTLIRAVLEERKRRKVTRPVHGSSNGHRETVRDTAGDESARLGKRKDLSL